MKRLILLVGGLIVVVVVALVIFLATGLGHAIKVVVEEVGSRATGTAVTLKSADVSISNGEGRLTGLVVGNPKGYGTPSAFELGDIRVKIDTSTVTKDVVVVDDITIESPHVTYEVGPGGSNIAVIQENCAAFAGAGSAPDKSKESTKAEGGRRFIVKSLVVKTGRVDVSASFLAGQKVGAAVREIRMSNIGTAAGGATGGEIAQELIAALSTASIDSVRALGIDGLKDSLKAKGVEGAINKLKDLLKK